MKSLLTNRKAGVYVLIVSILLQLVSAVNYLAWAPGAGGIDTLVALRLGLGCLAGIAAFLSAAICCWWLIRHFAAAGCCSWRFPPPVPLPTGIRASSCLAIPARCRAF